MSSSSEMVIQVSDARGSRVDNGSRGPSALITLVAGEGLAQLKVKIRKHFGIARRQRLAHLTDMNGDKIKKSDLHDGLDVRCVYISAPGNLSALLGGGGGGLKRRGKWV